MSVRVHRSERSRHLILRATAGEALPDVLVAGLREERVACGWLRASGVLADVALQAFDAQLGRLGPIRRIGGPVHVLALESSVGLADGEPSLSLRALLAREGDRGLETMAGEILTARTIALEAVVTVFDDLVLERALDPVAGISLLDGGPLSSATASPAPPLAIAVPAGPVAAARNAPAGSRAAADTSATTATPTWNAVADASAQTDREPVSPARPTMASSTTSAMVPMPQRPGRPADVDGPTPEAGDLVDHFAFGRCEVVKSDGDRLHLRVHKGGRIREIALEMLRVTPLESGGTARHFKLERRI